MRRTFFIFLLAALLTLPVLSPGAQGEEKTEASPPTYRIDDVTYHISGLTLRPFLEDYLDIQKGRVFKDLAEITRYVEDLHRAIVNNRVFTEDSSVTFEEMGAGDPVPVRVKVNVRNTYSALAVPLVKYNSTDGLSAALRYKDFNFLGTLEPLSLNLDYYLETGTFEAATTFTSYMQALQARWQFAVSGNLIYYPNIGLKPNGGGSLSSTYWYEAFGKKWYLNPLLSYLYERDYTRHNLTAGASTGLSFKAGLDWSASAYTYLNDQYVTSHYPHMTNGVNVYTSLKVADLPYLGALTLGPSMGIFGTYGVEAGRYTDAGYSASAWLSYNRVDMLHNLRKGSWATTSIYWADHILHVAPTEAFDLTLSAELQAYTALGKRLGLEFRGIANWFGTWTYLNEISGYDWSALIRGRKQYMYGDLGVVANLQIPINFAQGTFLVSDRFTAEVFVIPFLDAGYIRPSPDAVYSPYTHLVLCPGFDVVIFPEYARAFTYRLSMGYDAIDYIKTGDLDLRNLEVWLGLGLHF